MIGGNNIQIFVRTSSGPTVILRVNPNSTFIENKDQFESKGIFLNPDRLYTGLSYAGKPIESNRTFSDYGIYNESTLIQN